MVHELKCHEAPFADVMAGVKRFELRVYDRPYRVGDTLDLREYLPLQKRYTGQQCSVLVVHMIHGGQYGLEKGHVAMSIELFKKGAK